MSQQRPRLCVGTQPSASSPVTPTAQVPPPRGTHEPEGMHVLIVTGVAKCCTNLNFQAQFTRVHLSAGSSVPRLCQHQLIFILSQERSQPLQGHFLRVSRVHFPLGALPSACWRNTVGPQEISPRPPPPASLFILSYVPPCEVPCFTQIISLLLYSFWAEQKTADLDSDLGEVPMGSADQTWWDRPRALTFQASPAQWGHSQPAQRGHGQDGWARSQQGQHGRVTAGTVTAPNPSPALSTAVPPACGLTQLLRCPSRA